MRALTAHAEGPRKKLNSHQSGHITEVTGRSVARAWEGVGIRKLERISVRRRPDAVAAELAVQLQQVQAEREELVIAERVLNRLA